MLSLIAPLTSIFVASITTGLFVYGAFKLLEGNSKGIMMSTPTPSPDAPTDSSPQFSTETDDVPASISPQLSSSAMHYAQLNATPTPDPLLAKISASISGGATESLDELARYSRDTSIFKRVPRLVVFPKNTKDVAAVVRIASLARNHGEDISVTARSAGTDMSGGPLTTSIVAVFTKYMNKVIEVRDGYAVAEPGVFYRDFEKQTLAHGNQILPSYPASREIAALGGIVNNNSGGERSLEYGKTADYIDEMEVVLADGSITTFTSLTPAEVAEKKKLPTLEGSIYKGMDALLTTHQKIIENAKPKVSKNSSGYALWNVKDPETGAINLTKLVTGAQGTLAITTKLKLRLVKDQAYRSMLVIFLPKIDHLPDLVKAVLPHNPESFESFDEHTLSLAVKFLPQLLMQMGVLRAARLGVSFLPEVGMVATGGLPKLILMAEFSEDTHEEAVAKATAARDSIDALHLPMKLTMSIKRDERAAEKYWIVRRESFALLRKNSHGLYAAPFIDDFVVPTESYTTFLPELHTLLSQYEDKFIYTIAGHIGNGNFHIIPLMDLTREDVRATITELAPKVYELVFKYSGTTNGEHNDGIIRTPYVTKQFGPEVYSLFEQTKKIFDPHGVFNPGKKVGGTFADIERDMITTW